MVRVRFLAIAAITALFGSACGIAAPPASTSKGGVAVGPVAALKPGDFSSGTTIDNEWWPLTPGSQMTWEGEAVSDNERIQRRVIFTVTDLTKEIGGIRTLVGWERDYNDGMLAEEELMFLAQDKLGNVWLFGEFVEIYDDEGEYVGNQAWLAGHLKGARAGIMMPHDPKPGTPDYAEGFAPAPFNWNDRAEVHARGEMVCVPSGCYDDVLVIKEFEPNKPGAYQLKYYARGVGTIKIGWGGKAEEEKEITELTKVANLGPQEMAAARAQALTMEERAYVYGHTPPLEPLH